MKARRALRAWDGGWWHAARRSPSPNVGERPAGDVPRLVVLHSISLPPGRCRGTAVEHLFLNALDCDRHRYFDGLRGLRVSAHFFVRRTGEVVQFAPTTSRAWHAGVSRWRGRDNCNDFSIGIEIEGLEGLRFGARQYRVLRALLRDILATHSIDDIAGHEHVAPGRKTDPGPGFDWARLARALRGERVCVWPRAGSTPLPPVDQGSHYR